MVDWIDNLDNHIFYGHFPSVEIEWDSIPTLEQLLKHVTLLENNKKKYIEEKFNESFEYKVISLYDVIICNRWLLANDVQILRYQLICKCILYENSAENEEFTLGVLRLMFISPGCFNHLQENELQIITKKLIYFAIHKEEALSIHAIKCLQVLAYIFAKNGKIIHRFNDLIGVIIDRLISMSAEFDESCPISVGTLLYLEPKANENGSGINELDQILQKSQNGCLDLDVSSYIDVGEITKLSARKFHYLALLNYIIPHVKTDEILKDTKLMELLCCCIDSERRVSLALRCFSLKIIYGYANKENFIIKFTETKGIEKMLSISYNSSSNSLVSGILRKISENNRLINYIIKNSYNSACLIIEHALEMYSSATSENLHTCLINLIDHPTYYEILHKMGGIRKIINELKKKNWYRVATGEPTEFSNPDSVYKNYKSCIEFSAKVIFDHTLMLMRSITPLHLFNQIPLDNSYGVGFKYCDLIVNYFEKNGGIRHDVEFLDSPLEVDSFDFVVTLLRIINLTDRYSFRDEKEKLKVIVNILNVFKLLSLYKKASFAFTSPCDLSAEKFKIGNNIISYLRRITEIYNGCGFNIELIPFEIYKNLLIFCFDSAESYQDFMYSSDDDTQLQNKFKTNHNDSMSNSLLINLCLRNSLINHVIELLSSKTETATNIYAKICAIKCLLILTNMPSILEIICLLKSQIQENIRLSLVEMINCEHCEKECLTFFRYVYKLVIKIDKNLKLSENRIFKYLDENSVLDRYRIMNFICKYCPEEFIINNNNLPQLRLTMNEYSEQKEKNISSRSESIPSVKKVFELMLIALGGHVKTFPRNSLTKPQLLTNYLISVTSHSLLAKMRCKEWIQINSRKQVYKNFDNTKFLESPGKKRCVYAAKILNDDNIVITIRNGVYLLSGKETHFCHSFPRIYYIDSSPDGQLLIGEGIMDTHETRFVDMWRYSPTEGSKFIQPIRNWVDVSLAKITTDSRRFVGINKRFNINIFDIEKRNSIREFHNENVQSFARINSIEMNRSENVILFNEDLFCIRSGKLIHNFYRFSHHISGIFMPSNSEVLINTELWDLRTFKLRERIPHLINVCVKRTLDDNVLLGESIRDYIGHFNLDNHLHYHKRHYPLYGDFVALYNSKDLSQFLKSQFERSLLFASFSKNFTKLAVGIDDSHFVRACPTFRVLGIGH